MVAVSPVLVSCVVLGPHSHSMSTFTIVIYIPGIALLGGVTYDLQSCIPVAAHKKMLFWAQFLCISVGDSLLGYLACRILDDIGTNKLVISVV